MTLGHISLPLITGEFANNVVEGGPWSVLVTGTYPGPAVEEERFQAIPKWAPPQRTMHVFRTDENRAHVFTFRMQDGEGEESVPWSEVRSVVETMLGRSPGKVMIDITTLELECLLYLFPALIRLGPEQLFAGYTVPKFYSVDSNPGIWIRNAKEIQQPKGYGTFPSNLKEGEAARVLILGFDEGRANKFIQKYNWPQQEIWAVLGDPAYAEGGVEIVERSNEPVLKAIQRHNPDQIVRLPAWDTLALRDFLKLRLTTVHHLDIIPLGPKPLVLGALLFYFGLQDGTALDVLHNSEARISKADRDKSNVRFLYDFPVPRRRRSQGMRELHLYDCAILL